MSILRELITVLGFDLDDSAVDGAADAFAALTAKAQVLKTVWDVSVGAIKGWVEEAISAGDAADDTSKRLGITAQELQELQFAANRANVGNEQLVETLRAMQSMAAKAAAGSKEQAAAFKRLGVNVKDATGKLRSAPELFGLVADGLSGISNSAERTALAMKVAGRGGSAMLPLFLEGSKGIETMRQRARDLGFVLSNETAAAAGELDDGINDLGLRVTGLGRKIATKLFPKIKKIVDAIDEWFSKNEKLIDRGLDFLVNAILTVVNAVGGLISAFTSAGRWIDEHSRVLKILALVITALLVPAILSAASFVLPILIIALLEALPAILSFTLAVVAAALPWILLAAVIAAVVLVLEDVFVWASGGKSAIGALFKVFLDEPLNPKAHWLVKALQFILRVTRDVFTTIDEGFKGFFETAEELGGIWEALLNMIGLVKDKSKFELPTTNVTDQDRARARAAEIAGRLPNRIAAIPRTPAAGPIPGQAPRTDGSPMNVGGNTFNFAVTGAPGQSPADVANAAKEQFDRASEGERRALAAELAPRVVR